MNPIFFPQAHQKNLHNKGTDKTTRQTLNGSVTLWLRRWHSPNCSVRPGKQIIGIPTGQPSAGFRELACDMGMDENSSFVRQQNMMKKWGLGYMGKEKLRQIIETEGRKVIESQRKRKFKLDWLVSKVNPFNKEKSTMCVGVDGTMTRQITEQEKRKRRQKVIKKRSLLRQSGKKLSSLLPRKKGANGPWKEVKLVGSYDCNHKHRHWASTVKDHKFAGKLITKVVMRVGLTPRHSVVAIVDGASWIRKRLQENWPYLQAIILDYYHMSEHVYEAINITFGEGSSKASEWSKKLVDALRYQGYSSFNNLIKNCIDEHIPEGKSDAAILKLRGYIEGHKQMVDYPKYESKGWPIGSGPTESMAGILTARVKGRGRRWDPDNIDAIMALQALEVNDEVEAYWQQPPPNMKMAA